MIREIVLYPDPILQRPTEKIVAFDDELRTLAADMFESMYKAIGIGLAAPQVGVSKRITVIDLSNKANPEEKIVLVNPVIIHHEGKQQGEEGCLSLPDIRDKVTRAAKVTVKAQNLEGEWFEMEGTELLARAFQHEIDHLDGILFPWRISALKRDLILRKIRKLQKTGEWK
jgi:peptide deformylase